jgi:hypothetical protein
MPSTRHSRLSRTASATLLVMLASVFADTGCQKRTAMAAPPVVIVPATPENPAPAKTAPAIQQEPQPSEPVAPVETTGPVNPTPQKQTKKKNQTPASGSPDPAVMVPSRPAAPQISPQMSPGTLAALQQKTQSQMAATEKNLLQCERNQLTTAQRDEIAKIRSFLTQAQSAAGDSDWVLSGNLAEKAFVLSQDLLNSF